MECKSIFEKPPTRIQELVIKSGKKLKEISEKTGIPYPTLSGYNQGIRVPKIDKAQKLADYFEVSVPYLLGLDSIQMIDESRKGHVIDKLLRINNQRRSLLEQLLLLEEEEGRLLEQL
ncbi:UNVERIFIED_CONTAM: helix-turn-helix transcriptional regulator [Streptococcus canis]